MGSSCIICGRSSLVAIKSEGAGDSGVKGRILLSLWKKDCAETLCETLFGSQRFVEYFKTADFCLSCQKTTRDVNLTWKMVSRLKCQLEDLSTLVRKRLHVNHCNIQEKTDDVILDEMVTTTVSGCDTDWQEYSHEQVVQIFYKVACGVRLMPEGTFSLDELFPEEIEECGSAKVDELSPIKMEIEPFIETEEFDEDFELEEYNPEVKVQSSYSGEVSEEEFKIKKKKSKGERKKKKQSSSKTERRKYAPGDRRKYYDRSKDTITCQIESCDQRFRTKVEADAHLQHFHKGIPRPFGCPLCPKMYKWPRSVKDHMLLAHSSEKLQFQHFCKYCSKGYTSEVEMEEHALRHLKGPNPFICVLEGCSVEKTNFVSLKMHVQQIHPDVEKPKCEECGKVFANLNTLKYHRLLHQDASTLFKCPMCPHVSATKNRLNIHLISHNDSRPFTCETCGKGFKDSQALKKHSVMHTGEIVYECKICGKGFRSASSGRRHEEVFHLQVKNYVCQVCGRPFGNKSHLNDHLKIHQRENEQTAK